MTKETLEFVQVVDYDKCFLRLWFGTLLIRLAAWIMWFEIEWIDD